MNIDGHCIVLAILVIFFIYLDHTNSKEGFELDHSNLDDAYGKVSKGSGDIGLKPTELKMDATSSMGNSLNNISSDVGKEQLLQEKVPGVHEHSSQLDTLYPRFGGYGNLGSNPDMKNSMVEGFANLDSAYSSDLTNIGSLIGNDMGSMGNAKPKKNVELNMVYADWCGHSINALPDFKRIQQEYGDRININLHNVEAPGGEGDIANKKAKQYDVSGFPDIFFVIDGEKIEAPGRDYQTLKNAIEGLN